MAKIRSPTVRFPAFVLSALLCVGGPAFATALRVIYPAYQTATDTRFNDLVEILDTALKLTEPESGPYELGPSRDIMNESRYLHELKKGGSVNVVWSSTSVEKETEYLPLRIPLRKGILGYRIALIAKGKQNLIDRVKTVEDLKQLQIGQGIGWGDVRLYESNGLAVQTSQYDSLFKMVVAGRFDLFPRGITEVFSEYDLHSGSLPDLAIEQNLLIYYPWPYYFFFNTRDTQLKQRLQAGIHKMMKDGSFDAIFKRYNGSAIERADVKRRRVIRLNNPLLPKATPLNDPTLWFDPVKF
jgi:hypothetical protein